MSKISMRFTDSLTATTIPILFGTLLLLLLGPWLDRHLVGKAMNPETLLHAPWQAWFALLFLALGATVLAYRWFFEGIHQLGATTASAYNTLVPIFGVLFSWLFLNEVSDWSLLTGGILTVVGIALMNGLIQLSSHSTQ